MPPLPTLRTGLSPKCALGGGATILIRRMVCGFLVDIGDAPLPLWWCQQLPRAGQAEFVELVLLRVEFADVAGAGTGNNRLHAVRVNARLERGGVDRSFLGCRLLGTFPTLISGEHSLQRLFSTFPDGWPGLGLLLLRLGAAAAMVYYGITGLAAGAERASELCCGCSLWRPQFSC